MRKWAARPAILLSILAAAAVLVPSFVVPRHPRPGPAAEATRNLRMLKLLQERYFAENGRYAPDPDATAHYMVGATDIQAALPDYRPGPPARLLFDYEITSFEKGVKFTAVATGRAGTAAAGKKLSIDQSSRDPEEAASAEGVKCE